ncbi:hypothetical protein Pla52o_18220 [Novipirellula galeiformis]|uniref:Uncharacterized protein n=1 Tax=Novipirellula galeiformis TaxID=2528004 RepID=A0A5C6CM26_9BACT|nr:hypothetical protein [Novipirellula galeiformis]TWU23899.1 hypothetical protein Pla52o_18220 [Novipirellula galeiformis]
MLGGLEQRSDTEIDTVLTDKKRVWTDENKPSPMMMANDARVVMDANGHQMPSSVPAAAVPSVFPSLHRTSAQLRSVEPTVR